MEIRNLCLTLLLVALVTSQSCCDSNTVKVSGNAEIKVKPNIAIIQIEASAQDKTTAVALRNLNQKINSLISIIQRQGVEKKDYSTSSLSLNQVYEFQNGLNVLIGQRATQTLSVKIRSITADGAAIGRLIDAASKIDRVIINGVNFDQQDRTLGVKQARRAAFDAAKRKADQYALLSGLRVRGAIRIQALGGGNVIPFFTTGASFAGDFKTLVPVRDVTISENVNVWFSFLP